MLSFFSFFFSPPCFFSKLKINFTSIIALWVHTATLAPLLSEFPFLIFFNLVLSKLRLSHSFTLIFRDPNLYYSHMLSLEPFPFLYFILPYSSSFFSFSSILLILLFLCFLLYSFAFLPYPLFSYLSPLTENNEQ